MARKRIARLTAQKLGNWDAAIEFFDKLGYNVKDTALTAQRKETTELKKKVVGHILAQDLPWAPLSPNTKKRKQPYNRNKVYIDTETYLNSVTTWTEGNHSYVGIKKGTTYKNRKDRSVTVDQVAMWMEYGTKNTPARPLWAPSINEMGGAGGMRDRIAKAIYNRLKRVSSGSPVEVTYKEVRRKVK